MFNSVLLTILVLLIIGYVFLYFGGRKYLESFENPSNNAQLASDRKSVTTVTNKRIVPEMSCNSNNADNTDNYEVSAVYHNQGSREASKKEINDAMTRYPLDWAAQGQGSQYFQENQAKFLKKGIPQPDSYYKDVNTSMILPDATTLDEEERKILQTYTPESSKGLLQYSVDDVKGLLTKIYDKRGLIPVIEKSNQGENIWEIIEVQEKNPKIVWEDGEETSLLDQQNQQQEIMKRRGEESILVPYTVSDVNADLDPFLQASPSTRIGKSEYNQFTHGLNEMFTSSQSKKSWM